MNHRHNLPVIFNKKCLIAQSHTHTHSHNTPTQLLVYFCKQIYTHTCAQITACAQHLQMLICVNIKACINIQSLYVLSCRYCISCTYVCMFMLFARELQHVLFCCQTFSFDSKTFASISNKFIKLPLEFRSNFYLTLEGGLASQQILSECGEKHARMPRKIYS